MNSYVSRPARTDLGPNGYVTVASPRVRPTGYVTLAGYSVEAGR